MSSLFYLIAIVLVMASPLAVPVGVTISNAVSDWKLRAAGIRPATAGALRSTLRPAFAGAVPAAA